MVKVVFNPVMPISSLPVVEAPIFPLDAVNVIPAPAAVTWILAVDAVKFNPEVSMIDPAVAVMLTAPAADELVIKALAPRFTLRPEDRVIVPE